MPDLSRLQQLAVERRADSLALAASSGALREECLRLVAEGVAKTVVAREAGISRVTLDAWLTARSS